MKGARMRPYSLAGTRPAWTSRSVPRLIAPNSARTCTSPALGAATASSPPGPARPGPPYQSALPAILAIPHAAQGGRPDWTCTRAAISSNAGKDTHRPSMLERPARDEVMTAAPPALTPWRPPLFFAGVVLTMAALVALAGLALSPGGLGAVDVLLLVLFAVTLPWYVIGFC